MRPIVVVCVSGTTNIYPNEKGPPRFVTVRLTFNLAGKAQFCDCVRFHVTRNEELMESLDKAELCS